MALRKLATYFKEKKFLINITTLILATTLSLILISSAFIIFFNYSKSYQSILTFSKDAMNRAASIVYEKLNGIVMEQEQIIKSGGYFFQATQDFSLQNDALVAYMLGTLKSGPSIYDYFILKGESFIDAANIKLVKQTHYVSDQTKLLPLDTMYRLVFVDHSVNPPTEYLVYKNAKFETTATESTVQDVFNPFARPWYLEAEKSTGVFWTDIYTDFFSGQRGVTLGIPMFDSQGKMTIVNNIYFLLNDLDTFLEQQKIGNTGKAFILDSSGNLISGLKNQPVVPLAYAQFSKTHENRFIFHGDGTLYLASIQEFPLHGNNWVILVVVPFLDFFGPLIRTQITVIAFSNVILILAALIAIYFSRRISSPIVKMAKEIDQIKHLNFDIGHKVKTHIKEIDMMSSSIIAMQAAIRSFSHFVPKEIVNQLILTSQEIRLYGEKRELSIFFLDIRGFTTISENLHIEKLVVLLAEYYDALSRIIITSQGTIDKYMGDNIMAFWGAPLEEPEHAVKACTTALYCQKYIDQFNQKQRKSQLPEFQARIGLHLGEVIVGNIGTEERMNYTIIGDPVNVASRLEGLGKTYQTKITISEDIYNKTGNLFLIRPLDYIAVRGKTQQMKILELVALKEGDPTLVAQPEQIELCSLFSIAYEAFFQQRYQEAKELLTVLQQKFPNDYPTRLYLERLQQALK